jgi:hypothetical protein
VTSRPWGHALAWLARLLLLAAVLAYTARDERGRDSIRLVDPHAAPGTDPTYVADGPLAYWFFD